MSLLRHFLILIIGVFTVSAACGAVQVEDTITYLPAVRSENAACVWEPAIVKAALAHSGGALIPLSGTPTAGDTRLSIQVIGFELERSSRKSRYTVRMRANVSEGGKLLATRDFEEDASFTESQTACSTLNGIGASLGESAGEWMSQTRLPTCAEGCTGLHPDEPIVVATEVLIAHADAINDTVRDDCQFQTALVTRLVKAFNESDRPSRARLEARSIDIEQYSGRRLILRVNNVHALGGGGFSGPKWMNMSGELRDGKLLVGSFHSHTTSGRGVTTCRSVDALIEKTVELISEWLSDPVIDADL
ncbi:hypothetical protein ACFONG_12270 [Uliginosibacterium paludis]|uniref:Uncharacterized protein n=1 Tax=Uliginosibacterium paludis TaxID=1615952 RepID=A0ABV2CQF2_9RHOO